MDGEGGRLEMPVLDRFSAVEGVLETNRLLINEINRNHELRTPEALARNVVLIRQLNANVGRVVEMYREVSRSFASCFGQGEG